MIDISDAEAVHHTLKKDKEYFGVLIDRYSPKLSRYITRITQIDDGERDDILQEVFIKAYVNLNDFDKDLSFSSWIYRICHNEVISRYRKLHTKEKYGKQEIDDEVWQRISSDVDIVKELSLKEERALIDQVFSELDYKHKEILTLKFFEDKEYKEISDILQKPTGTVGTLVHRAKKEFIKIYNAKKYEK